MKIYEVYYQNSDSSKINILKIKADYYSINKEGNEILYFWQETIANPIASFASSIWLHVAQVE